MMGCSGLYICDQRCSLTLGNDFLSDKNCERIDSEECLWHFWLRRFWFMVTWLCSFWNQEEEPEAKQRCLPHNGWQPAETGRKGTWYTYRAPEHGSRDPPPNMLHLLIFLKLPNDVIKF